jgi:AraC-like DNA-binding protein
MTNVQQKSTAEPSVIAGYAGAIARALHHRGIDSASVLSRAGLGETPRNDPLNRLSVSQVSRLFRISVEETGDPYFGLTVARFIHASNIHALGYALMASRTLWDFCLRLQRYFAIVSQAALMRTERTGAWVALRFRLQADLCGETEDAFFAFTLRFMRLLYGKPLAPVRVDFHHNCPAQGAGPYAQELGVTPQFGCAEGALVFAAAAMDEPLAGACPDLAQFNDRIAADCLVRLNRHDVVARVRAAIVEGLPTGACNRANIARELGFSQSALQLRLAERGTTFHALVEETRFELSLGYLSQPALSITEIAFLLGFADTSNFSRAFKRWHGISPRGHRETGGLGRPTSP